MERSPITRALVIVVCATVFAAGCTNPFAPSLRGSTGSLWTDASTVGELLENFRLAYELGDSLRYSELLADEFQFQYYDPLLQRTDGWYRETDLRATARMFRTFQSITLIWGGLSPSVDTISTPDTPFEVRLQYQLLLDDDLSAVFGFARFTMLKPADGAFQILLWQSDF